MNITYHCLECDWEGKLPSWSDTSETRENAYGVLEYTHRHVPVCPECHRRCAVRCDDNTEEFVWATH